MTSDNYAITYNDGSLTVTKTDLSVTANGATKVYNGSGYPGGNGVSYSGFVNSEKSDVLEGVLVYGGDSRGRSILART